VSASAHRGGADSRFGTPAEAFFFTFEARGYGSLRRVRNCALGRDDLLENSICDSPARKREKRVCGGSGEVN
jgi:hypothetical protein